MSAFKLGRSEAAPKTGSILSSLTFSAAVKPTKQVVDQRSPRDVVREFIETQIAAAKADLAGTKYLVPRTRFVKGADGRSSKVTKAVEPRRAYWQNGAEWLLGLKYGNVPVELTRGNPSIQCGSTLHEVIKTFELLKQALDAGECDAAINAAAEKAKRTKGEAKAA